MLCRLGIRRVRQMLGPVVHARRLFGDEVIDAEILSALPELANEGRRRRARIAGRYRGIEGDGAWRPQDLTNAKSGP